MHPLIKVLLVLVIIWLCIILAPPLLLILAGLGLGAYLAPKVALIVLVVLLVIVGLIMIARSESREERDWTQRNRRR